MINPCPKPNYKKQRAKIKREQRKRDLMTQTRGNPRNSFSQETEYVTCPGCGRTYELEQMARHHVIKRRNKEFRHDDRNLVDLCQSLCHVEVETIGNVAFAEKHKEKLLLHDPYAYHVLSTDALELRSTHAR